MRAAAPARRGADVRGSPDCLADQCACERAQRRADEVNVGLELPYLNELMDKRCRSFYVKYLLLKRQKALLGFMQRDQRGTTREGVQMRMIKAVASQFCKGAGSWTRL